VSGGRGVEGEAEVGEKEERGYEGKGKRANVQENRGGNKEKGERKRERPIGIRKR
jgi:hypothetical protein